MTLTLLKLKFFELYNPCKVNAVYVYAIFTSDSRFDPTNGPCSKQVLISCRKMSGEPILIQASYQ